MNMPMDTSRLQSLRSMAEALGCPWRRGDNFRADADDYWYVITEGGSIVCRTSTCREADLVIAAVNMLPSMCDVADEREWLRPQNERLKATLRLLRHAESWHQVEAIFASFDNSEEGDSGEQR